MPQTALGPLQAIDAPAPPFEEKNIEFTQKIRARMIGILLPIFSVAFVGVPFLIGGGVLVATVDVLFA